VINPADRSTPERLSWVTIWTAVGSLAAVGAIIVAALTGGGSPESPAPTPDKIYIGDQLPYSEGNIIMPVGYVAYVYSFPSLSAPVVAQLPNGTSVKIRCTKQGDVVNNNNASSSLWNKTDSGYIPDVNVYTGTMEPTMPSCPTY